MTQQTLARSVIAPLGGLLKVGAVTATGSWRLSEVSVAAYVTAHQAEVDRLLSGIQRVGAFGEVFLTVLDELGYLRDHEVTGPALLLWSGGVEGLPVDVAELEEPSTVQRMCRMAADLQLTEFQDALITAAVAAGVETGAGTRKVAEVLGLADGSGRCSPVGAFRMWRVARLPSLLRPGSDAPEWGKAGFRRYERGLAELLDA
ncbi:hypothetical protein [Streptomyces aquilus]|uniref:hypothetical protein n=1 Tax=Streptomyces aquilus TaxID=2548456 RepID=UPI0036A8C89F